MKGFTRAFELNPQLDSLLQCLVLSEQLLWLKEVYYGAPLFAPILRCRPNVRRKTPWKLSPTRKANARARLKRVDAVIEAVRVSGIQCGALVSISFELLCSPHPNREK